LIFGFGSAFAFAGDQVAQSLDRLQGSTLMFDSSSLTGSTENVIAATAGTLNVARNPVATVDRKPELLRMNSVRDPAVMESDAARREPKSDRSGRFESRVGQSNVEAGRLHGGFASESLTNRARTQRTQDRDIGRWGWNPMKTKLVLALASLAAIMSLGCASAAPRYHTYSLPKYQASVEVQAPIGKDPEVVARITFGELGGPAR